MSNESAATVTNPVISQPQPTPQKPRRTYISKPTKLDGRKVKALALAGVSISDIAKHQDVNHSTVWRFLTLIIINHIDQRYYLYYNVMI